MYPEHAHIARPVMRAPSTLRPAGAFRVPSAFGEPSANVVDRFARLDPMISAQNVFRLAIVILAISATAGALIGKGPFPGLDFQNMDTFHDCVARDNPYLATGEACGDYLHRNMRYPPLLYWSFIWTRALSLEAAYAVWVAFTVVATVAALAMWVPASRRDGSMLLFAGLLLLQFPMLFQIERGNSDAIPLLLWSVSAWLLMAGRAGWAGLVAGLSVLLKLYPAFAVVVVLAGLLAKPRRGRLLERRLVRYCAGGLVAVALLGLPLIGQTIDWLDLQMPSLLSHRSELNAGVHELHLIAPDGQAWLLSMPLLVVWSLASHRLLAEDPALVLSGALAISTYFANVAVDYNLITTYPFLIVLFIRATSRVSNLATVALLVLGLIAIIGHRGLFILGDGEFGALLHIWLQWVWLMAAGIAVALGRVSRNDETREQLRLLPSRSRTMTA